MLFDLICLNMFKSRVSRVVPCRPPLSVPALASAPEDLTLPILQWPSQNRKLRGFSSTGKDRPCGMNRSSTSSNNDYVILTVFWPERCLWFQITLNNVKAMARTGSATLNWLLKSIASVIYVFIYSIIIIRIYYIYVYIYMYIYICIYIYGAVSRVDGPPHLDAKCSWHPWGEGGETRTHHHNHRGGGELGTQAHLGGVGSPSPMGSGRGHWRCSKYIYIYTLYIYIHTYP